MTTDEASLETRLLNVRHRLGQHLSTSYLTRLLDNLEESNHTRTVLQAVIMVLGQKYMSDRSLYIIFKKKSTITKIKTWDRCKLDRRKIWRIRNWMEFRPQTFGEISGYKGDKLLHALRDWCLIMVETRKRVVKQIATSERETQSSLSPKIKVVEASAQLNTNDSKAMESISTSLKRNQSKTSIKKSNSKRQTSAATSIADLPKQTIMTARKSTATKGRRVTVARKHTSNGNQSKTKKLSKEIQGHSTHKESATNTTLVMNDKCVGAAFDDTKQKGINAGVQVGGYKSKEVKESMKTSSGYHDTNISMITRLKIRVHAMNDHIDENLLVLLDAKKELDEAKRDANNLKREKRSGRKNVANEWNKQREYILRKIAKDQERLQTRLCMKQATFV